MSILSSIAFSTGTYRPIEAAATTDAERSAIRALREDGFDTYLEADMPIAALAGQAMAGCLAKSGLEPGDIDATVFSTESFWDFAPDRLDQLPDHLRVRNELIETMAELGLVNAYPYGSWMSACANLAPSLKLAKALIDGGLHRNVMLVLGDRQPRFLPRVMRNGAAVYSDIMAACLVRAEGQGFALRHIVTGAAPRAAAMHTAGDHPRLLLETKRALRKLDKRFSAAAGRTIAGHGNIIAPHFHRASIDVIYQCLNIIDHEPCRDGRGKAAHSHAVDNLITLDLLDGGRAYAVRDEILLLNTAVYMWNAVVLERV